MDKWVPFVGAVVLGVSAQSTPVDAPKWTTKSAFEDDYRASVLVRVGPKNQEPPACFAGMLSYSSPGEELRAGPRGPDSGDHGHEKPETHYELTTTSTASNSNTVASPESLDLDLWLHKVRHDHFVERVSREFDGRAAVVIKVGPPKLTVVSWYSVT